MEIYSGQTSINNVIFSNRYVNIWSGGTANSTHINSGGRLIVSSGGKAYNTTIRGNMYIRSGGIAQGISVSHGGMLYVSYGGTATNIIENGGYVSVAAGAKVTYTPNTINDLELFQSATLHSGTVTNNTTIESKGALYIYTGGIAKSNYINSGGRLHVSGGTVNNTDINSGGAFYVSSGTVNSTNVNSGGVLHISSGTVNSTNVNSGGVLYISGGTANNTDINSGGTLSVLKGGYIYKTNVNSHGLLHVSSGGYAANTSVNGGLIYLNDATMNNITANSAGELIVFSGGLVKDAVVNYEGRLCVSDGGIVSNTVVCGSEYYGYYHHSSRFGYFEVFGGGMANGITLNSFGNLTVYDSGIANNISINGNGYLHVSNGGVVNNIAINSGGYLYVSNGGSATILYNPWLGNIVSDTEAVVTYLERENNIYIGGANKGLISSTDILDNFSITSGLSTLIFSGGTANRMIVNPGGYLYVSNGGTATISYNPWQGNVISDTEAVVTYLERDYNIYIGRADIGLTNKAYNTINKLFIDNGYEAIIYSGGTANNTTINSYGNLIVSNGGTANRTNLNSTGRMYIYSGGFANHTNVIGSNYNVHGYLYVYQGGTVNNTTVDQYSSLSVINGGRAISTTLNNSAVLFVSDTGCVKDTSVINATFYLHNGFADNTIISSGGIMIIENAANANNITVSSGGSLFISSGGTAENVYWKPFESVISVADGASVTYDSACTGVFYGQKGILISQAQTMSMKSIGKNETIYVMFEGSLVSGYVSSGSLYISSGGSASCIKVFSNGKVFVKSGGAIYDTVVEGYDDYWDKVYISNGGYAYNTTLSGYRACLEMYSGAIVSKTIVSDYSDFYIFGGTAIETTVSAGDIIISGQGTVVDTTLYYFGNLSVANNGSAVNTTIYSGGALTVSAGGFVSNTVLSGEYRRGPDLNILSRGTAYNTVVKFGGKISVEGLISNTSIGSGGSMTVSAGGSIVGTLNIEEGGFVNVLSGGIIKFDLCNQELSNVPLINNLSLITGAPTYTITVSADQADGTYKLAQGAEDFAGSIIIGNGSTNYGTLAVNDNALVYNNTSYTLNEIDGDLTLTIAPSDVIPPELNISGVPENWTNEDITLYVSANESCLIEYQIGDGIWTEYSDSGILITANTSINFRATDAAGNVTEKSIVVDKIDKVAPTLEINVDSRWTCKSVIATAEIGDDLSGVSNVEYSFNVQDWIVGTSATVQRNGTIYWKVTDFAGNVSYTSSVVSNIVAIDPETESPIHVYSGGLLTKDGVSFDNEHITSDHLMYVTSGGIANNTTVNGGSLAVHDGAKVTGVTFKNGGTMNYYGGTAYNVELGYGGIMTIESGAVRSGQIVDKGKMFVSNGGTASGAIIKNGGVQHVLSGGSADDTQIWLNGVVQVSSGAVVTDMLTKHGAKVHVFGGTISNTTMERGITSVYQGGKAVETEVGYGAYLMLGFTSDGCSGVASSYDTTVLSGGGLTVMSGAVAEDTVNYGTLTCNDGGKLLGETVIHGRANLAGNAIVTSNTAITFDVSGREASAMQESYREAMLNSYYVAREADMTISVSADQAEGSYILANWALEAKKGTFTLEINGTEVGTFSTTKSLTYDGKTYSLYCFDDSTNSKALTLKVCDATSTDAWTNLGSGDFDGDGIEESLVSDGTNLYAASEDLWLGNLSATEEIASITDYNNDGMDDILIHNTATDQMTAWLVKDGATYSTLAIA